MTNKMDRILRTTCMLSLLLLGTLQLPTPIASAQTEPQLKVFVEIEGKRIVAPPGLIVARGQRAVDGRCQIPAYTVIAEGNAAITYSRVVVRTTGDCGLLVEAITAGTEKRVPGLPPDGTMQTPKPTNSES